MDHLSLISGGLFPHEKGPVFGIDFCVTELLHADVKIEDEDKAIILLTS